MAKQIAIKRDDLSPIAKKLLEEIKSNKEKLNELLTINESKFNVTKDFYYNPNNQNSSVELENANLKTLIEVTAFLNEKKKNYDDAAEMLELNNYPEWNWMGFTWYQWIEDIKIHISQIDSQKQISSLQKRLRQLTNVLPEEVRIALALNGIEINALEDEGDLPF